MIAGMWLFIVVFVIMVAISVGIAFAVITEVRTLLKRQAFKREKRRAAKRAAAALVEERIREQVRETEFQNYRTQVYAGVMEAADQAAQNAAFAKALWETAPAANKMAAASNYLHLKNQAEYAARKAEAVSRTFHQHLFSE